jgi:hypothetical protein
VPDSEVPCDENGIPTPAASRNGMGFPDPDASEDDEDSTIFLSSLELEAVRRMAQEFTFKGYVDEHLDDAAEMKEEFAAELGGVFSKGDERERFAKEMVSKLLSLSYVQGLAKMVKDYPHSPTDIIHHFKGKKSKGAKRYKEYVVSTVTRSVMAQQTQEWIDAGYFVEYTAPDGTEYLKAGPNYEEFAQRRKDLEDEED